MPVEANLLVVFLYAFVAFCGSSIEEGLMGMSHLLVRLYLDFCEASQLFLRLVKQFVYAVVGGTQLLNEGFQLFHPAQRQKTLLSCLLHVGIFVLELLQQDLKEALKLRRGPVEVLGFSDHYGLEGIYALLAQLWLWTADSVVDIEVNDLVQMLVGLHEGQQTVVGGLAKLRLGIAQVDHHLLQQFSPDIILDVLGIEVDDL